LTQSNVGLLIVCENPLGELAGLECGDVQFDGLVIEVRRNRTGGTPTNGKVRRTSRPSKRGHVW
jgi:hypothetical protein